jgi:predicted nuclease of predicted toxin-antitoxin system
VKLLIDEMWEQKLAQQLRLRGYVVDSMHEREDLAAESDELVFTTAQTEKCALVTENVKDFRPLASRWIEERGAHHGLILTDNRRLSHHRTSAIGRMAIALNALLESGIDLTNREIWLS